MKLGSALVSFVSVVAFSGAAEQDIQMITSTPNQYWQPAKVLHWDVPTSSTADPLHVEINRDQTEQTIQGFGGCFNEKGWEALKLLPDEKRGEILRALFDPAQGCGLTLGRIPMGANDYSLEWYSYDETPEDYALTHFSIARDQQYLIPYIHQAQKLNPQLRFWASPWCPPSWMKTNGHYAGAPSPFNDLKPAQAGREMHTQFRMEPRVLAAYALYFGKFLDAYRAEGINIDAVHVQNEPNSCQNFPSCIWTPGDLAVFISGYLGPRFEKDQRTARIWLGTMERPDVARVEAILADPGARPFIAGVGFQWGGKEAIAYVRRLHPELPLMQTETECGDGANDWAAAEHTFRLMNHYFNHGAGAYMFWNMVLDETGASHWGWRQNAMITVNRQTQAVVCNPEFILMKHFSHFVRAGARKLKWSGSFTDGLAFRNSSGESVLILVNLEPVPRAVQIKVDDKMLRAEIPATSFNTLVLE